VHYPIKKFITTQKFLQLPNNNFFEETGFKTKNNLN